MAWHGPGGMLTVFSARSQERVQRVRSERAAVLGQSASWLMDAEAHEEYSPDASRAAVRGVGPLKGGGGTRGSSSAAAGALGYSGESEPGTHMVLDLRGLGLSSRGEQVPSGREESDLRI